MTCKECIRKQETINRLYSEQVTCKHCGQVYVAPECKACWKKRVDALIRPPCKRNSKKIPLFYDDIDLKKDIRVDSCIANLILHLRDTGIDTLACCCGHGKYNMSIVYIDNSRIIRDLISGARIPRKKRFYVKDDDGFYYIPEAQENKQ